MYRKTLYFFNGSEICQPKVLIIRFGIIIILIKFRKDFYLAFHLQKIFKDHRNKWIITDSKYLPLSKKL